MDIKSRLKPEGSAISGLAVVGTVIAIYNMDCGNVANAAISDANHPLLETSRKKAGYTAFVLVSVMTLVTKDANVGILGYAAIVATDLHYRQAIMANPATGKMEAPNESVYAPAMYAVPDAGQGDNVAAGY